MISRLTIGQLQTPMTLHTHEAQMHHWAGATPRPRVEIGAVYGRLSVGKGFVQLLHLLVGAAMYPTCRCGFSCAAGHNAIRAFQVPIVSSHSKCTAPVGSPDPAVSTGFLH